MKSEDFAQSIQMKENNLVPDFSQSRPGTDKRVYAYAYVSSVVGSGRGVSVQVYNHSDGPIATDKLFRELTLVTWNGTRYDRSQTEMMFNRDSLGPGENATFNFTFPGIRVPKEEIRMIVCSFDLGSTMIPLMPVQTEGEIASERTAGQTPEVKDRDVPPSYPLVKVAQVIAGTKYEFLPALKKKVDAAESQTHEEIHRDRPWSLENPDRVLVRKERLGTGPELPRNQAQVVHVNLELGFVVVNAGYEDGLDKNKILEILRDGHRIGKVMITKPRGKISGAIILPEWRTREEIQVGDQAGISP